MEKPGYELEIQRNDSFNQRERERKLKSGKVDARAIESRFHCLVLFDFSLDKDASGKHHWLQRRLLSWDEGVDIIMKNSFRHQDV